MDALESILRHAKEHSPFYGRADFQDDDLATFPVINRSILHGEMGALLTLVGEERRRLLAALDGTSVRDDRQKVSEFKFSEHIVVEQTSGSSGVPLRLPKTTAERMQLGLMAWRQRTRYDPAISRKTFLPIFHRQFDAPLPVSPFASTATGIQRFYQWADAQNIRWLHAPPGLIAYHAALLRSIGLRRLAPSLLFVEASGAPVTDDLLSIIEENTGAKLINQYGTRECWAIGYAAGAGPFDLNLDAVHVELLDDANQPITRDGIIGDVVTTSKVLRLLPLIRYRTGDRGSWLTDNEPGRGGAVRRLVLALDRDINMLVHNGKLVSGNILFKDIFHAIDHKIGYGAAKFIQVRKIAEFGFKLILHGCDKSSELYEELKLFYSKIDPRITVSLEVIDESERQILAERKPYFFVNEWDPPKPKSGDGR